MPKQKPTFTTVVRRQLGRRLRTFRKAAGLVSDDVADAKIGQRTKLWRYEHGRTAIRSSDVMALCHLYEVRHNTTIDGLVRMADKSGERNYVEDHDGTFAEDRYWMHTDLETLASSQVQYSSTLIPDLVQTRAYARAVISADPALTTKDVERRVTHRMRRQRAVLDQDEPGRTEFLVPASALELTVGSPEVTAEQIAHLVATGERDGVDIRILPGFHRDTDGSFTLMDFADPDDPPVVCLGSLVGSRYVELPAQVATYRRVAVALRQQSVPLTEHLARAAADQRTYPSRAAGQTDR